MLLDEGGLGVTTIADSTVNFSGKAEIRKRRQFKNFLGLIIRASRIYGTAYILPNWCCYGLFAPERQLNSENRGFGCPITS